MWSVSTPRPYYYRKQGESTGKKYTERRFQHHEYRVRCGSGICVLRLPGTIKMFVAFAVHGTVLGTRSACGAVAIPGTVGAAIRFPRIPFNTFQHVLLKGNLGGLAQARRAAVRISVRPSVSLRTTPWISKQRKPPRDAPDLAKRWFSKSLPNCTTIQGSSIMRPLRKVLW